MGKSPGHQKWPDHKVHEARANQRVTVQINGQLVADSNDVIRVDEDGSPPRYYFPRADVRMDWLERTATSSECPFKGTAQYFSLRTGGHTLDDAVWSYEDPYDEHRSLKERLAFYDDKYRDLHVASDSQASQGRNPLPFGRGN
ncbi:MAG: DUF427 domain-containing protein [Steroidobacteraceae bacterium]